MFTTPLVKSMKYLHSLSDNVWCKGHQMHYQVKRTSRLRLKRKLKSFRKSNAFKTRDAGCVLCFKCKIANAKIYEDKRDLYCSTHKVIKQDCCTYKLFYFCINLILPDLYCRTELLFNLCICDIGSIVLHLLIRPVMVVN